jgi:hypothetical protein
VAEAGGSAYVYDFGWTAPAGPLAGALHRERLAWT